MGKNYTFVKGAEFPYQYKYEHMAVTTDCVIFTFEDRELKVLLIKRGGEPYKGQWAFPGGFLRINETARDGALRELKKETSLEHAAIGELGVFSDVDRDPRERVITIAWYALVKPSEVVGGDDANEAAWFPIDKLPTLAFDHQKIFDAAMERLRRDIHFDPIGFDLLDDTFTIPDLQKLYEIILGTTFDRRNFQRKILASGILEPVADEAEDKVEAPQGPKASAKPVSKFSSPKMVSAPNYSAITTAIATAATVVPTVLAAAPAVIAGAIGAASKETKKRPGRNASLFKLNKDKYDEMKAELGRTEF